MKKLFLAGLIIFILGLGFHTFSQEIELPAPGLTPDSSFYFLERIFEKIGTFFTFGDLKKAERYAKLATERIAEAKAMIEKGKIEAAKIALERYEDQLSKALNKTERAKNKGKKIEKVAEIVAKATSKHFSVLEKVKEKVPEPAKEAINKALEKSKNGHIVALKALAGENPKEAVEINIESAKECLERAKKKAKEGNKEKVEKALKDYEDLQNILEEIRGKGKILAILVSEERIEEIKDLDEIEDEVEKISEEIEKKVKEIKEKVMERQKISLRDVANEDPEKATEINLKVIEARLKRAEAKAEEGEIEKVKEAVKEFENQYKFGEEISETAQSLGKDITKVEQLVGKATSIHLEILTQIYEKVPQEAKSAIEKAIEVSTKGHQKAIESLKAKEALGEVPEEIPFPEEFPEKIKEKIQKPKIPSPELPKTPKSSKP